VISEKILTKKVADIEPHMLQYIMGVCCFWDVV